MFARSFAELDERDQAEIMNLIRFKEQVKAQRTNNGTLDGSENVY